MTRNEFETQLLLLGWDKTAEYIWEKDGARLDVSASWGIYLHLPNHTYVDIGPYDKAIDYIYKRLTGENSENNSKPSP